MAVEPTGPLSLPFAAARTLLAACATWQAVCGVAGDADAAAERIHLHDLPPPDGDDLSQLLPCAVLLDEDGLKHRRNRVERAQGQLILECNLTVSQVLDERDQLVDVRNKVGAILEEMLALAHTPNGGDWYWGMTAWDKLIAPQVVNDADARFGVPQAIWTAFVLDWLG